MSPRSNTVSVRIGTDGYSPWTFPHWKSYPPVIMLVYGDGVQEELELVPPVNYRNLSPILSEATAPGQKARSGYDSVVVGLMGISVMNPR